MQLASNLRPTGTLTAKVNRGGGPGLRWKLSNYLTWHFIKAWLAVFFVFPVARRFGLLMAHSELRAKLFRADGSVIDYGVVSRRVVTDAFVAFVVDNLQTDTTEIGDFKYHDSGVGTTAEAAGDTAMETTDGESRATGTQTESAANAYRSVGTIAYTTTKAITEHGVFSQSTSGTLLDRSKFSALNVVNGDSIQFTYTLTLSSGG